MYQQRSPEPVTAIARRSYHAHVPSEQLSNAAIADRFELMADLLELEGAVVYRVLAYRRAAKSLRETAESVARLSAEGRLTSLPGVGETVAAKVARAPRRAARSPRSTSS